MFRTNFNEIKPTPEEAEALLPIARLHPDHPDHLWLFNDGGGFTVRDYGNGRYGYEDATMQNGESADWVNGRHGTNLDIDGSNEYSTFSTAKGPSSTNHYTAITRYEYDSSGAFPMMPGYRRSSDNAAFACLFAWQFVANVICYSWSNTADEYFASTGLSSDATGDKVNTIALTVGPTAATVHHMNPAGAYANWTNTKTHAARDFTEAKTGGGWQFGRDPSNGYLNGRLDYSAMWVTRKLTDAEVKDWMTLPMQTFVWAAEIVNATDLAIDEIVTAITRTANAVAGALTAEAVIRTMGTRTSTQGVVSGALTAQAVVRVLGTVTKVANAVTAAWAALSTTRTMGAVTKTAAVNSAAFTVQPVTRTMGVLTKVAGVVSAAFTAEAVSTSLALVRQAGVVTAAFTAEAVTQTLSLTRTAGVATATFVVQTVVGAVPTVLSILRPIFRPRRR